MRELTEQERIKMVNAFGDARKMFPKGANITDGFEAGYAAGLDCQVKHIEKLARALMDEIYFSKTPSQNTLDLLSGTVALFPELSKQYEEMQIAKMEPVE